MSSCIPILRREIELLRESGVDTVQLDEPWLAVMVDPEFREAEGVTDVAHEMDVCVDVVNRTLDGIEGLNVGVHLCHAHFERKHITQGSYDLIMPALAKMRVDVISLELATPVSGGFESLARFPENVNLGFGCVDHCDRSIETPEKIVTRVEQALAYVDKRRIILHPDCGFSPSVQNPMDLDEAYLKLKAMCRAAELLRQRYA
jgi:5-methyltetrahydropteroyltriglutamate--homocysteine methyltransferase